MPAPKGNRFWEQRAKHGRDKIFSTPDMLWEACQEYFVWTEENPLNEEKIFCYQGQVTRDIAHKMRAMTIEGLCLFLGVTVQTWNNYRNKADYKDFFEVITRAEEIMRVQKFQGAAADLLNPNIIARDLGLADRNELTGKGGASISIESSQRPQLSKAEWLSLHGLGGDDGSAEKA